MFLVLYILVLSDTSLFAQSTPEATTPTPKPAVEEKWYDTFKIRGYLQIRYNRLLETNEELGRKWWNIYSSCSNYFFRSNFETSLFLCAT